MSRSTPWTPGSGTPVTAGADRGIAGSPGREVAGSPDRGVAGSGGARRRILAAAFAAVYFVVFASPFVPPHDPVRQYRDFSFAPPVPIHLIDESGALHWPFVYRLAPLPGSAGGYGQDPAARYPLRWFVPAEPYTLFGVRVAHRLVGVDEPARLFLLGTDQFGRDQWSRLLVGARVSLVAGPLAALLSIALALVVGGCGGFFGGVVDEAVMRAAELCLVLPWLYLLFAVRAVLPLHLEPDRVFLLIVLIVGLVGWARPARLVRGIVLSARERDFVVAARGLGGSPAYVLGRHVLPQAAGVALVQAAILVPQYILAEVTLSFLGLGVAEPMPSWGNMLAVLQRYGAIVSYWWLLAPAVALIPVTLLYYALAETLRRRS